MLGHECSKTRFDATSKLPRKKTENLGGNAQGNTDYEVCKANADAKVDIGG